MNPQLQSLLDQIQQSENLSDSEKTNISNTIKEVDKVLSTTEFKLDRTEQVKRTTAILLEETIQELEQKRKAVEAQNRELEIESSLERVRTVAMSMNKPDDMLEVCTTISLQLQSLGVKDIRNVQTAIFYEKAGTYMNYEYYAKHNKTFITEVFYTDHEIGKAFAARMLKGKGEISFTLIKGEEKVKEWLGYQKTTNVFIDTFLETASSLSYYWFSLGPVALGISTYVVLSDDELSLFKRFLNVFELAYRRFIDIEQAEAQAREARIEAALERIRAKVMAMNNSKELSETSLVFGEQLRKLGLDWQFSYFWLIEEDKDDNTFWITWPDYQTSETSYSLTEANESFKECIIAWRQQDKIHSSHVPQQEVKSWLDTFERITKDAGGAALEIMTPKTFKEGVYYYDAIIKFGSFGICINRAITEEEKNIQCRFAVEFERAYTRFLELKKAEAQAREAKIEAALERVRSRTMGMQKSDELKEVIQVVYDQFVHLNIHIEHTGFILDYKARDDMHIWLADQQEIPTEVTIPYFDCAHWNSFKEAKEKGVDFFANKLSFEEKNKFYQDLFELVPGVPEEALKYYFKCPGLAISTVLLENVGLYIENFSGIPYTDEENATLMRFGKVFQQTYTRFLDLQKAEMQAREAQIEASLERVRSRAMAMHKSDDLNMAVATVFEELDKLNPGILRCGIAIMDKTKPRGDIWVTVKSEKSTTIQLSGDEPLDIHPMLQGAYDAWLKQQDFSYVLQNEDLLDYYKAITITDFQTVISSISTEKKDQQHYYFNAVFQDGSLFAFMETEMTDVVKNVIKRFANVFNLTYKRFLDLQKAEAQAREAQIEASLERVRANAMAMHNSADLSSTVNIFFKELKTLGITPMRCGVGEMLEGTRTSELVFTTADKQGELYELPGKLLHVGHPVIENIYNYWKRQEEYHPVLQGTEMIEYYKVIKSQMILPEFPEYTRHFGNYFYFKEGFFFAWAEKEFTGEAMNIFRKFTSVLSLTYKRYKDLKQAEAQAEQARLDLIQIQTEKKRAEDALIELNATQAQLIQSEKMASLGELTAGIAHEIQNPLNFVNNFSEVNTELIEEMKQEIAKENLDEVIAIANDIKDNQEKITHHGKRADAIVKGMLQHSRTSSGVKEPTDINALADEYLRLAYHGLRAKDKSFNAKMLTDFDESIGLVNVIPQEIGRVILNLITNAFYAVSAEALAKEDAVYTPQPPKGGLIYEPTVMVSTKRTRSPLGDLGVEVRVKDNGSGIPSKVIDKIFQPFFTTKPTGQGTGLGLSLSYDIVKAHGGDLKVETKEGEGSEFIIELSV